MFDQYLIRHITDYLKLCNNCKKYNIINNKSYCCICKIFYCSDCNNNLNCTYGFYKNKYCKECYIYYCHI